MTAAAWAEVPLGEVCALNPSPRRRPASDEVVSFLGMSAVSEDGTTELGEDRAFSEVAKGYTLFERDDVLLAKITPCFQNGKIAQARPRTEVAAGSTEFHVLRPVPESLDNRYLLHLLRLPRVRAVGQRRMTGSGGQRRVPESFLAELTIPLPPIEEQRRVAAVLDAADAVRVQRREALALLDTVDDSIFADMFGDPAMAQQRWPRQALAMVISRVDSGKSPVCLARRALPEEWGVLKLGAVTGCRFDERENKALPFDHEPDPRHEVHPGDVLLTRKNTMELVGACAYVETTRPGLLLSDLIFRLVIADRAVLEPRYLQKALAHRHMQRQLQRLAGGSAGSMPNISKKRLLTLELSIPPIDLQRRFADRVAEIEDERRRLERSAERLDELFASLQQRAFRGEL